MKGQCIRKAGERVNIYIATKKAFKKGKCITLKGCEHRWKIKPTNDVGNCIFMNADGSNPSKYGWQPSAEDFLEKSWIVVD